VALRLEIRDARARHQPCEAIARFARAQQRVSAADDREHWHPQRRELFVGANRDALQPRTKVREHRRHRVHQHGGHFPSRDDRKRSPQPPRAAHSQQAKPYHRELLPPRMFTRAARGGSRLGGFDEGTAERPRI